MSQPIDVEVVAGLPGCGRCGQPGLIAANVPEGWRNAGGSVPVVLCAGCDHDSPTAGPLVVYLLVHDQITEENLRECAVLIQRWIDGITAAPGAPDSPAAGLPSGLERRSDGGPFGAVPVQREVAHRRDVAEPDGQAIGGPHAADAVQEPGATRVGRGDQ